MTIEKSVGFTFKGRYFDNGVSPEKTKAIWFIFHGYRQLANFFIKKFDLLKQNDIRVIAPEGLSKFYIQQSRGRVGASWMTRENRLMDIDNYISYINSVYTEVIKEYTEIPEIHALGFSQGAATVCRWVLNQQIEVRSLILWAGLFPPDVDFSEGREFLTDKQIYFVYGNKDPYLSDERFKEYHELNEKLNVSPEVLEFDGGHDIDEGILEKMIGVGE